MMAKFLSWRTLWLLGTLLLYIGLASYQLGLPGLHYDEAAEAGVNAMQLLTGAPVSAFRDSTITLFGWRLPLMVQDYIGALNVYLALPVLALTGIGVPNLRAVAILTGLLTLLLLERTLTEWQAWGGGRVASGESSDAPRSSSPAPLIALTLLAASPSFVFWSRQGIFVTNLMQPLCLLCIWQGLRWLRLGNPRALILSALAGGLALYAKLLAVWVIGPCVLLAGGWWLWRRFSPQKSWIGDWGLGITSSRDAQSPLSNTPPVLPWWLAVLVVAAFLLGVAPLILFNLQTGGVGQGVLARLDQSYYGVDNRDLVRNAAVRWGQLVQSLRGDHLWYLDGIYGNPLAPWLGSGALLLGLIRHWRLILPPLLLLLLTFLSSLFTISDLFITHYALVQPLVVGVIGLSLGSLGNWGNEYTVGQSPSKSVRQWRLAHRPTGSLSNDLHPNLLDRRRTLLIALFVALWLAADLTATLRYHGALTRSGGLADHADASYHLAYYLRYHGLGAPLVLDWGLAAPVRYLSEGAVTPLEIFGYNDLAQPDAEFTQQLRQFLANPANVYLLHAPEQTVFAGRREVLAAESQRLGLRLQMEASFAQRDGTALVEIWRAER